MIPGYVPKHGRTLVVGSKVYKTREDRRLLFPDREVIGLDIEEGPGVDLVHDLHQELPVTGFDHVDCVSVLEHVERPWEAAANIEWAMVPGATIFVSVPWVWRFHSYGGDHWRVSPSGLRILFPRIDWQRVCYQSARDGITDAYPKPMKDQPFLIPRCEAIGFGVRV